MLHREYLTIWHGVFKTGVLSSVILLFMHFFPDYTIFHWILEDQMYIIILHMLSVVQSLYSKRMW